MVYWKIRRKQCRDISITALVIVVLFLGSWVTQGASRYVPILLFPLIFYLGLLFFFNRYGALAVVLSSNYLLHLINQKKMQETAEPIMALDLIQFRQAAALTAYMDVPMVVAATLLVLALIWALIGQRSRLPVWLRVAVLFPAASLCLVQTGKLPYVGDIVKKNFKAYLNIKHMKWDMPGDVRQNGLLCHLWFTAEVFPVPKRTSGPISFYNAVQDSYLAPTATSVLAFQPFDIYLILCESCWGQENRLQQTPLNQLLIRDFQPSTIFSPVFGGETANAEFELLTALPAPGLRGVVFMSYGAAFRGQAATLPSELSAEGFKTYAMHNGAATFWKRNVVYPKFGFKYLTFIEEMPWDGKMWPDDQLLFDAALKKINESTSENRFFFLVTVHTHGPYDKSDDRGHGDFQRRLQISTQRIVDFVDKVKAYNRVQNRRALFLVFGDHKPSLAKWFYDEQVLASTIFSKTGKTNADFLVAADLTPAQRKELGSVPLFTYSDDPSFDSIGWSKKMHGKPFYCLPAALANIVMRNPSIFFRATARFCESDQLTQKIFTEQLFGPEYFTPAVYAERLFW